MMNETLMIAFSIYFAVVNFIAATLAYIDKKNAVKNKRRIPEKTLLTIGFFGGAAGEYMMMKKIRHKTKHAKFMLGLPLEFILHITIIIFIIYRVAV